MCHGSHRCTAQTLNSKAVNHWPSRKTDVFLTINDQSHHNCERITLKSELCIRSWVMLGAACENISLCSDDSHSHGVREKKNSIRTIDHIGEAVSDMKWMKKWKWDMRYDCTDTDYNTRLIFTLFCLWLSNLHIIWKHIRNITVQFLQNQSKFVYKWGEYYTSGTSRAGTFNRQNLSTWHTLFSYFP